MSLATLSAAKLAWREVTLVILTTFAPSGILACALCAVAVAGLGVCGIDDAARARLSHLIALPLAVSMVGLVAAAGHLGTPSNALYVISGVGRSPLSNEVACCVAFMALTGLYWLYSFSRRICRPLQRAWCVAIALTGCIAVVSVSLAYSAPTIVTWSHWSVPVFLCCSACAGAPLLAFATATLARVGIIYGAQKLLLACGVASLLAAGAVLAIQWDWLGGVRSGAATGHELVPAYPLLIALYVLLGTAAYVLGGVTVRRSVRRGARPSVGRLGLACALYFIGLFVMRFAFYMTHMTVGIGL